VGLVFVGVAAVACQLVSTTRAASGLSAAALALAFLASGLGNMAGTVDEAGLSTASAWPAWLSPMGWGQQVRPFGDAVVWPLGLGVAALAGLLGLALLLAERRDIGRGMWSERRGPAHAPRSLPSPAGLTWRLQRTVLASWAVGMALFGLIFGSMSEQIRNGDFAAADWAPQTGGTDVVLDAFLTSMVQIGGMFVAVYAVQVLLRMRVDETGGTLEPLLATAVTRTGWAGGHLLNAVAGSVLLLLLYGLGMGLTAGRVLDQPGPLLRELTVGSLLQLPGVLVMGAVVVAAVGLVPRWAAAVSWSVLVVAWILGPMFGPALDLPAWLQDLSPFSQVPQVPATDPDAGPVVALVAVAVVLAATGVTALRRRELLLPA
jgi:ABC-2 type transport system permease protein